MCVLRTVVRNSLGNFAAVPDRWNCEVGHLWLVGNAGREWDADVLRLMISCDTRALDVVVGIVYANRDQLGPA